MIVNSQERAMLLSDRQALEAERGPSRSVEPWAVAECAETRLRHNSYLALKNVSCEYRAGVLTLRGCLPSYYLKQMAQAAVAQIDGVERVVNEIQVLS
jgi:osmotically-inducible protein OsmY